MKIKKLFHFIFIWTSLCLALASSSVHAEFGQPATAANAADGILVQFRPSVSSKSQQNILNAAGVKPVATLRGTNGRLTHVHVAAGRTLEQTLAALARNPNVEFAEPNYLLSIAVVPNDPLFPQLWGMHNTGQTGGVADADIDAPEAWDLQTGNNVVIAVVDTGVDYNHADLRNNIWSNTREISNNGIDDDGNGFVDDVRGWDFVNNDNNPMDDNRHGTHVAGTIAAQGNNAGGVTGVNWSARVMPVKFSNAAGVGTTAAAINAINYAVRNGAKVINASWGGGGFSQALFNAINAANNAGVLFVAAAGNNGTNNDVVAAYPANYNLPNIISVAASDSADVRAGFSNFGPATVDLAAPGVAIRSTVPTAIIALGYASLSGTSMAAPHVAGVAGLVLAQNSTLTVAQLKSAILNNVDRLGPLTGVLLTGGRLNAFKAVSSVTAAPPPTPGPLSITPQTATLGVGGVQAFTASGGVAPYTWSVSNPALASITATGVLTGIAPGTLTVSATASNGVTGTSGIITISAVPPPTTTLTVTPSAANVLIGGTQQFTATGGVAPYLWWVNNTAVANIDSASGLLTGIAAGLVIVTAADSTGKTGSSGPISISATPPAPLVITPATAAVAVGASRLFTASGGRTPYTWVSSNPAAAIINATTGVLTGVAAGVTTVTATDATGNTGTSGTITINAGGGMGGGMGGGGMGGGM